MARLLIPPNLIGTPPIYISFRNTIDVKLRRVVEWGVATGILNPLIDIGASSNRLGFDTSQRFVALAPQMDPIFLRDHIPKVTLTWCIGVYRIIAVVAVVVGVDNGRSIDCNCGCNGVEWVGVGAIRIRRTSAR